MNLFILWTGMLAGGIIYHTAKLALGYPFDFAALWSASYWTGFALAAAHFARAA